MFGGVLLIFTDYGLPNDRDEKPSDDSSHSVCDGDIGGYVCYCLIAFGVNFLNSFSLRITP